MKFSTAFTVLSAGLLSAANAQSTVVDVAVGSADHTTLVELVTAAGLVETLQGDGPFTVFAPTNDAFADVQSVVDKLSMPEWSAHLTDVLTYHVAAGSTILSTDLTQDAVVPMVNGENTTVTSLDPPMINDANIVAADLVTGNGVVHATDKVLLPMSVTVDAVTAAMITPDLSTLVELVGAADLVETLQGDGPFTIFAPTNDAFAKLDNATVAFLTSDEGKEQLVDILTYHVYSGIVTSDKLTDGDISMVNGDPATVTAATGMINDATVTAADVLVSNGVVHLIDTVLMPPADDGATTDAPDGATTDAPAPSPTDAPSAAAAIGSSVALLSAVAAMFLL